MKNSINDALGTIKDFQTQVAIFKNVVRTAISTIAENPTPEKVAKVEAMIEAEIAKLEPFS